MKPILAFVLALTTLFVPLYATQVPDRGRPVQTPGAQPQQAGESPRGTGLADIRMRDVCILPDQESKTYYMVGPGRRRVRAYTSKDLVNWVGPQIIFQVPAAAGGQIRVVGIWAPELHFYKGKYYLFLTFDTRNPLCAQWRDWLPRGTRGSQVRGADAP